MSDAGLERNARTTLQQYYDGLSLYQVLAGWLGLGVAARRLTVHRLLTPGRHGVDPADVVHERVIETVEAISSIDSPHVLDAGCGNGGTIFYCQARWGGRYDGLTLSPRQRDHAVAEARRRGLAGVCRFHLRSYDDPIDDLLPGGVDVVVAIESLAHAPDPAATLRRLARAVRSGGCLVVVDDVPGDGLADSDPDFAAFREGWRCPAIARRVLLLESLRAGGLIVERDEDLTPLVVQRDAAALERWLGVSRIVRPILPGSGLQQLAASFHGGLMLERLYRRGVMQYRVLVGRAGT